MNVSSVNPARKNLFIQYANSLMSVPSDEQGKILDNPAQTENNTDKNSKGIETLTTFSIYPKQVVNGRTIITA